jgi:hypothetical protein
VLAEIIGTIIVWLTVWTVLLGLGLLAYRAVGVRPCSWQDTLNASWIGLAVAVGFAQIWHLIRPIDVACVAMVAALGVVGLLLRRASIFSAWNSLRQHPRALGLAIAATVVAAVAVREPIHVYDTGLYHLQAIEWLNSFAVVPGLGNLHGRLAFNNSSFDYAAMLNAGPLAGQAVRLANAPLILLLLALTASSAVKLVRSRGDVAAADYLRGFMFVPTLAILGLYHLANGGPDPLVWTIEVVLAVEIAAIVLDGLAYDRRFALTKIAVLASLGITLKLSFAPFGVLSLVLGALALGRLRLADLTVPAAAACALLLPWLATGVMLSGYPLYPSSFGAVPVDWRVPEAVANSDASWIAGWARQPGADALASLQTWSWLGPWFALNFTAIVPAAAVCLVALALTARTWRKFPREVLLAVPVGLSLVFWFASAPDPRFAGALLWLAAAIPALCARRLPSPRRWRSTAMILSSTVILQLPTIAIVALSIGLVLGQSPTEAAFPEPQLATRVTDSGLVVYMPTESDQAWEAPLPSTPYFDPHLQQRCADSLACGFRMAQP